MTIKPGDPVRGTDWPPEMPTGVAESIDGETVRITFEGLPHLVAYYQARNLRRQSTMRMTREELLAMSLEDAQRAVSNAVYAATGLIEDLQVAGKLSGNGHHARQAVAALAAKEVADRWKGGDVEQR